MIPFKEYWEKYYTPPCADKIKMDSMEHPDITGSIEHRSFASYKNAYKRAFDKGRKIVYNDNIFSLRIGFREYNNDEVIWHLLRLSEVKIHQ